MSIDSTEQNLVNLVRMALVDQYAPLPQSIDVARLDWQSVVETARHHRLETLLYEAIKTQNWQTRVPSDVLQSLKSAYTQVHITNLLVYVSAANVIDTLARADIPFVLLKGCALAESLYPNIGLRPTSDVDVLVPVDSIVRVSSLLGQLGYEPSLEPAEGFRESFEHERCFVSTKPTLIPVDVHWHLIHVRYYYERIPVDWFWQHTMQTRLEGRSARILAPEAQFVHLMMHYFFPHQSEGLLWSHDLALLLARYRETFDWDQVLQAVQVFHLSQVLQTVIAELETVWNVRLSDPVRQKLERLRPTVSERIFVTAYSAEHTDAQTVFNILSVSGMRAKFLYLWRTLFPTREYMQTRYRISHPILVPFYYLARLGKGMFMFLRSVVSMGARLPRLVLRRDTMNRRS